LRWQANNRERLSAYMREYRATSPVYRKAASARERKYQYGITDEMFRSLVAAQDSKCAICLVVCPVDGGPPQARLCVDHCHTTGKVRGLLCRKCNLAVGALRDRPELADAAAAYLRARA
jgi:hypothetical protein